MAWDLATAKVYLGIDPGDNSKDVVIQLVLDRTLDTIETYLHRGLLLTRETALFYDVIPGRLFLPRWPVKEVFTIDEVEPDADDQIDYDAGWIYIPCLLGEVAVDYEGGFETLPSNLEWAMWQAFMLLWSETDSSTGGPAAGSGPTIVTGSGEVSSVTIQDLGRIAFDVGSSVSGGTEAARASAQAQASWGWLAPWAPILELYRRGDLGVGLGMA